MKKPIRVAWDNSLARRNLTGTGVYAARLLEPLAEEPDLALESFTGWPNTTRGGGILRRTFQAAGSMAWSIWTCPRVSGWVVLICFMPQRLLPQSCRLALLSLPSTTLLTCSILLISQIGGFDT